MKRRWVGNVIRMNMNTTYRILVGKPGRADTWQWIYMLRSSLRSALNIQVVIEVCSYELLGFSNELVIANNRQHPEPISWIH
jgi:hypothetical protein